MKTKQGPYQSKRAFVVQIITAHGDYISAEDAWAELVDKRATTLNTIKDLQQTASAAVSEGLLSKKRGPNDSGKTRTLYGPPGVKTTLGLREATVYPDGKIISGPTVKHEPNAITEVVWPKNPVVADIPLGQLLEYLGWDMDDVMSVIRDAVCDRPLVQLRMDYPGLEEVIKRVVGVE
jgi:hypothetical protein